MGAVGATAELLLQNAEVDRVGVEGHGHDQGHADDEAGQRGQRQPLLRPEAAQADGEDGGETVDEAHGAFRLGGDDDLPFAQPLDDLDPAVAGNAQYDVDALLDAVALDDDEAPAAEFAHGRGG